MMNPCTRIISPTGNAIRFIVVKNDPIEVRFIDELDPQSSDLTYVVDEKNRKKISPKPLNINE